MVLVYIDYVAVLNSVSHLYLDKALKRAGASKKSRALHEENREQPSSHACVLSY